MFPAIWQLTWTTFVCLCVCMFVCVSVHIMTICVMVLSAHMNMYFNWRFEKLVRDAKYLCVHDFITFQSGKEGKNKQWRKDVGMKVSIHLHLHSFHPLVFSDWLILATATVFFHPLFLLLYMHIMCEGQLNSNKTQLKPKTRLCSISVFTTFKRLIRTTCSLQYSAVTL